MQCLVRTFFLNQNYLACATQPALQFRWELTKVANKLYCKMVDKAAKERSKKEDNSESSLEHNKMAVAISKCYGRLYSICNSSEGWLLFICPILYSLFLYAGI